MDLKAVGIDPASKTFQTPWVNARVQQLRLKYEEVGFEVVERPAPDVFPFEVGYDFVYRPAMLARRGNDRVVIELREEGRLSSRFLERAEEILGRSGWYFFVVTDDDVLPHEEPARQRQLLAWWQLERMLHEALQLVPPVDGWIQLLALWTVLEGVMRRLSLDHGIPAEALPAATLIPILDDEGLIPSEAYEPLRQACDLQRRVRHGYETPAEDVAAAVDTLKEWLPRLFPTGAERTG